MTVDFETQQAEGSEEVPPQTTGSKKTSRCLSRNDIRLRKKLRELDEVENLLQSMKERHELRVIELRHKRQRMEARHLDFSRLFLSMNKNVQRTQARTEQALAQAWRRKRERAKSVIGIFDLHWQLSIYQLCRDNLKLKIARHEPLAVIVNRTLEQMSTLSEFHDMVVRHDSLVRNMRDLDSKRRQNRDTFFEKRRELDTYVENATVHQLKIQVHLRDLEVRLEEAQEASSLWEGRWLSNLSSASATDLRLGCILLAVHSLYRNIRARQKKTAIARRWESQLTYIGYYVIDLATIPIQHDARRVAITEPPMRQVHRIG